MHTATFIEGLKPLANVYDTFMLDQWGVLHFGKQAPSYVIETLEHLKERGKSVVIISNSGKGADFSVGRLEELGINRDLYTHIVTSGEMVRQGLTMKTGPVFQDLGETCYLIADSHDETVKELPVKTTTKPADANFILMTGVDYLSQTLESYDPILKECLENKLPLICANPDMVAVEDSGTYYGPGALAARYKEMGGEVRYIGKPHKSIFAYALTLVANATPSKTIMVGDSMGHDILGGAGMGFDTCLISTGSHEELFKENSQEKAMQKLEEQYNTSATYVISHFSLEDIAQKDAA